jgi:hypothetical protein
VSKHSEPNSFFLQYVQTKIQDETAQLKGQPQLVEALTLSMQNFGKTVARMADHFGVEIGATINPAMVMTAFDEGYKRSLGDSGADSANNKAVSASNKTESILRLGQFLTKNPPDNAADQAGAFNAGVEAIITNRSDEVVSKAVKAALSASQIPQAQADPVLPGLRPDKF